MIINLGECLYCKQKWNVYAKNLEEYQEYLEQKEEVINQKLICPSCQKKKAKEKKSVIVFPKIKQIIS